MNDSDKGKFLTLLLPMGAVYNVEMPKEQMAMYWLALKGMLTIEEFERAVSISLQTLKWLPKPSELIECVKPSRALLAWEVFTKVARRPLTHSINFQDPLINAVVRSKGGLRQAYRIPDDVFFSHYRRDFLEAYRNFERGQGQPDTSPLLVGGNHESSETLPPRGIACRYVHSGIGIGFCHAERLESR